MILKYYFTLIILMTFCQSVFSQTYINSDITTNTTWTFTGAPYYIQNPIKINAGVTLQIDSGVNVKFFQWSKLTVDGELIANGNSSQKILFTSFANNPNPGYWDGIVFTDLSNNSFSILKNCIVEYADVAIKLTESSPIIDSCLIQNNRDYHIALYDNANCIIKNSTLTNTVMYHAINISSSSPTIVKNIITNVNNYQNNGINIVPYNTSILSDPIIEYNIISGFKKGIYSSNSTALIKNNNFNNNGIGIEIKTSYGGVQYSKTISGNSILNNDIGIYLSGGAVMNIPLIEYNKISQNTQKGIYISFDSQPIIHYNNLFDNGTYAYDVGIFFSSNNIDAQFNWWGIASTQQMNNLPYPSNITKIWDYFDHSIYGFIDYNSWLSDSVSLGPFFFSLMSPSKFQTVSNLKPAFTWQNTTDPTGEVVSYKLFYDEDSTFSSAVIVPNITTNYYTQSTNLNDNTIYYWKVAATDGQNTTLSNEQDWQFAINLANEPPSKSNLILPPNGSQLFTTLPKFIWTSSLEVDPYDSVKYTLVISTDSSFNQIVQLHTNLKDTSFSITNNLSDNSKYCWKVISEDLEGLFSTSEIFSFTLPILALENENNSGIPKNFILFQNFPNPFNPVTHIRFGLPKACDVKIEVYNILGQKVATILDEHKPAGFHVVDFDGRDFTSGLYYYRIKAGEFQSEKKMLLLK